ncbi:hypothetical protein DFQ12_2606 [Sphingobacterium detergens]|uniref:Uncharacterized protein n=1 Tax=Sphingobacterium detergens TaxID=1145106 RepID=A0A420B6G2_SPHD1|nr:hypothetical protein DFQ12_2606 [Sphingobacterium detergens]
MTYKKWFFNSIEPLFILVGQVTWKIDNDIKNRLSALYSIKYY